MGSRTGVTRKRLREPPLRRLRALDAGVGASCSSQRVQSLSNSIWFAPVASYPWNVPKPADTEPHPTCPNCGNVSISHERRALEAAGEEGDAARDEEHADRLLDLAELLFHRARGVHEPGDRGGGGDEGEAEVSIERRESTLTGHSGSRRWTLQSGGGIGRPVPRFVVRDPASARRGS